MVKIPVRNKSKDNPYILGFDEKSQKYTVEFVDNKKTIHKVKISEKVYAAFDKFELEDVSQIHKYSSHIEHSELTEESLSIRAVNRQSTVEEIVEQKMVIDELKEAIDNLSDIQKRRLKLYYFENLTLKDIAKLENCSIKNIHKSIEQAKDILRKKLKK